MAGLQDCATELLLDIYLLLDNIDDALHLARCSKRLYAIFDTRRFQIFKSIILSSSIHAYDVMLCHFQDAFHDFSSKHLSGNHDSTPAELHPPSGRFEQCLHLESVSDEQIWDIVARWQGLRSLQHLYLDPVINSKYTESPCVTGDGNLQETEMLGILRLARNGKEISYNNGEVSIATTFSPSETGRFYKALTGYWVATESLKLARQCRYRLQSIENTTFDKVRAMWRQRTDLQESLDVLEVFDFVYGFLCQHIDSMDPDSFTDWVDEGWLWPYEPLNSQWNIFIKNIWLALSPADVLELLHFTSLWREQASGRAQTWSNEKRTNYLRMRGFFDISFPGSVMISDVGETPDVWYSTPDLEKACKLQLQKIFKDRPTEAAVAWAKYRTTLWQTDACGRFGQMLSARLLEFITLEIFRALNPECAASSL